MSPFGMMFEGTQGRVIIMKNNHLLKVLSHIRMLRNRQFRVDSALGVMEYMMEYVA